MTGSNSRFPGDPPPDPDAAEDVALVTFLRANASAASPPSPNLENQIMASIAQQDATSDSPPSRLPWRTIALVGAGVAAVGVGLGQLLQPPTQFSTAQLTELESFMVDSLAMPEHSADPLAEFDWNPQSESAHERPQNSLIQAFLNGER